jgi:hypothetical protein
VCSIKLHLLLLEVLFDLNANIHTSGQIPSSMLSKSLELLFNFGRVLALTPSYRKPETSLLQKCYALAIITLITIALGITISYRNFYKDNIYIKSAVCALLDVNLLMFNYSTVVVFFWKHKHWEKLVVHLKIIVSKLNQSKKKSHMAFIFFVVQVVGIVIIAMSFKTWMEIYGLQYVKEYNVQYFQFYLFFTYNVFLIVIISLILALYEKINKSLGQVILANISVENMLSTVNKLDYFLSFLKETVQTFNEIFAWPIALLISYTCLHILNNSYSVFVQGSFYKHDKNLVKKLLADIALVVLFFVIMLESFQKPIYT